MGDRKSAMDFYNAGLTAIADKSQAVNPTHAYQMFVSACYADPMFAGAFYQVGNNNSDLNLLHGAVACYRRALEVETDQANRAKILCNMAWRLHGLGLDTEALDAALQSSVLAPELAYNWVNLSLIRMAFDRPNHAVMDAKKAFALLPDDPTVQMALAWAHLYNGDLAEGFKHYDARFRYRLHQFLHYPYPAWKGEPDKVVSIVSEQGLGDTLSFARFVPLAAKRARFIHLVTHSELLRLFQHAFVGYPNINVIPLSPTGHPPADAWTTFTGLPLSLGLTDAEIRDTPHISNGPFQMPAPWKVAERKFHIGIAWAGSRANENDRLRSIPAHHFLELCRVPGVQLYSLQCGERAKEMSDLGSAAVVRDIAPFIRDVTDDLAIQQHLDLVITCDSAPGHIRGLANKECWIPYSFQARDWRLGLTGNNPIWYPKHRVFRQDQDCRWEPVFSRIVEALRERVGSVGPK